MNIEKLLKIAITAKVIMTIALVAWTITLYTNEQETPLSYGRFIAKNCLFQRTLNSVQQPFKSLYFTIGSTTDENEMADFKDNKNEQ